MSGESTTTTVAAVAGRAAAAASDDQTTTTTSDDGLSAGEQKKVNLPRCASIPRQRGLKKEERDRMLQYHRDLRQKNLDGAELARMPQLQWDHRLEGEAQRQDYLSFYFKCSKCSTRCGPFSPLLGFILSCRWANQCPRYDTVLTYLDGFQKTLLLYYALRCIVYSVYLLI